ncbi:PREDICTED: THO complex subunit 4-A-like [Nicrophorus vespilloides]|uniref:THO complex subunit 4-A-like n=1 Tax=Nicrophorus vespilloides TaxID=110193 RepID=A0ABM1MJA5_NICVS|nr:PREDICTED: THO complex subunit 4-A-like [Nicrophorus vespilloides]
MVDKIDMSLDDIIKSGKKQRGFAAGGAVRNYGGNKRGGRGGGITRNSGGGACRSGGSASAGGSLSFKRKQSGGFQNGRSRGGAIVRPYTRGDVNSAWKHDLFKGFGLRTLAAVKAAVYQQQPASGPTRLFLSNLYFGVSDSDIQELFAEFGPLKRAAVHYNRSGWSLGTADIVFERKMDAHKALKQYNGVSLDGRAMIIQITTSEMFPLRSSRRTPPAEIKYTKPSTLRARSRPTRGTRGGRGAARNAKAPRKSAPTAEELDAELDAYIKELL